MNDGFVEIRGAREHNLKNVSLRIPHGKISAFAGVSGSGKSSLAFDTLFAEGRRRYLESLPGRAAAGLEKLHRPAVDFVDGLAPAIAVAQGDVAPGPRAILATEADLLDPFRLLFAHAGTAHCPRCGRVVRAIEPGALAERLLAMPEGTRLAILSPMLRKRGGGNAARQAVRDAEETLEEARRAGFVRVRIDGEMRSLDELDAGAGSGAREIDAVVDRIVVREGIRARLVDSVALAMERSGGEIRILSWAAGSNAAPTLRNESSRFFCPDCELALPPLTPERFSFLSRAGACEKCEGTGLDDSGNACKSCGGARLRPEVVACRLPLSEDDGDGPNLPELLSRPVSELRGWTERARAAMSRGGASAELAATLLPGIAERLGFLARAGLGYLAPWRAASTLSGGELRRVRLAAALGRRLGGALYVLDEPAAGLHPCDTELIVPLLKSLRDAGNTVVVVEHDETILRAADRIFEFGPGAGAEGGRIVREGPPSEFFPRRPAAPGGAMAAVAVRPPPPAKGSIRVVGASANNLRGIDVDFPLGRFTVVTGVSGSGKTSLVRDVLAATLAAGRPVNCKAVVGAAAASRVVEVGRAARVRNTRSIVLSACGAFETLRGLYAATPLAKARGYGQARFSFNARGGRCEACGGEGVTRLKMGFLPDIETACETCGGRRFNRETLEVHWMGRSIADTLEMTASEAVVEFSAVPALSRILSALVEAGLGHLALGQRTASLSGGEMQRLLLVTELSKPGRGFRATPPERTLYLLDEPGTGQHPLDLERLLATLLRLRDAGGTVVAVEHHPQIARRADWIVDLGPGAGEGGGDLVVQGTPDEVRRCAASKLAPFL